MVWRVVDHRHQRVHVVGRTPRDPHAQLRQYRRLQQTPRFHLFGVPEMTSVETFQFRQHIKLGELPGNLIKLRGGVGHDVVTLPEVHGFPCRLWLSRACTHAHEPSVP